MRHPLKLTIEPYTLHFRKPASTSRGVYLQHKVWYLRLTSMDDSSRFGIGECAPLQDLSCDDVPDYLNRLRESCDYCEEFGNINYKALRNFPSILFGLETAFHNYERGSLALFDTPFSKGISGISINGLIWMGTPVDMFKQIEEKIAQGYRCIKLKIGSLDVESEIVMLKKIRTQFSPEELILRVDANGAFTPETAPDLLKRLSELGIHSIEQPIRAGQWNEMAKLTGNSPLPIALDEELIGCHDLSEKRRLLEFIRPHYLVLKPTLHGGFFGCDEWIQLANALNINWWVTSALESNIGLNAIAQWCATYNNPLHQGLGTGQLYTNNIDMPLYIQREQLWFNPTSDKTNFSAHFSDQNVQYLFSEYETNIEKQTLTLEGNTFTWESLQQTATASPEAFKGFRSDLLVFLKEWFSPSPTINIKTSGSTGKPIIMAIQKIKLIQSACLTCSYFSLQPGDSLLLCLSLDYIAGKMMVIRSLVGKLNLYLTEPDGHPFRNTLNEEAPVSGESATSKSYLNTTISMVSMVPMQLFNTLQVPAERKRLLKPKKLLLGGGPIDPELEKTLQTLPNEVYVSYGMAETLSHIAMRRANGINASLNYRPLPTVKLSLSETGCLVIDAPLVCDKTIWTNDLAEIFPDGTFRILGRIDNTIVTGGKKVQIETLETMLSTFLSDTFAVTSLPDAKFGEIIVLLTETSFNEQLLTEHLQAWLVPKHVMMVPALPRTISGKLDRAAIKQLALSLM